MLPVITDAKDRRIAELERRNAELEQRNAELEKQLTAALARIAQLEAIVADLTEKLNKNSRNSSKPPSTDPPWKKPKPKIKWGKKRKQGAQKGHEKHERPLVPTDQVDQLVTVKPSHCEHCGLELSGEDNEPERIQQFDIPKIEPMVTEYQVHTLFCTCGKKTHGKLPDGVSKRVFLPNLVAHVCWLTGKFRLSKRAVVELLSDLLQTKVSLGAVSNMEREMSAALFEPYKEAASYVSLQPEVNADETGWREKNVKAWLWVAVTPLVALFKIDKSRGAKIAKELIGECFGGILGSDRWTAYLFVVRERRQLCWAHLIRDFQAFLERGGTSQRIGEALLDCTRKMFKWWHKVRDGTMSREDFQKKMLPIALLVGELLAQGSRCHHAKTAGTCIHMLDLEPAFWTFVHEEGVEPTNNAAEQTIRHAVLWRKTSFGTQSEAGSRFVERILTVTATLRLQRRNVLAYLSEAISAHRLGMPAPSLLPCCSDQAELAA